MHLLTKNRAASAAIAVTVLLLGRQALKAQTAPPYAIFQNATITGSENAVTALWLPVANSAGKISYQNVTIQFAVDATGALSVASLQTAPAPAITVAKFAAGTYQGPGTIYDGEMFVSVSGPGITSGGATEWTLATTTNAYFATYPATATWYVTSNLANNPIYARVKAAKITSTAYSYGVEGDYSYSSENWATNTLLGFSQVGNTITIYSFTHNGVDQAIPVDQITYTLTQ